MFFKYKSFTQSANFSVPGAGKTSVMIAKILLNESKNILVFVPNDVVMDAWINIKKWW